MSFAYFKGFENFNFTIIMLALVTFDALVIGIEEPFFGKVSIAFRGITYLMFIALLIKKLNFKAEGKLTLVVSAFVGLLNLFLMYSLISSVNLSLFDTSFKIITLLTSICIVSGCVAAANYNFNTISLKSTYFMIFVLVLAFGDIASFSAFYLETYNLYYADVLLLVMAAYCYVNFVSEFKINKNNSTEDVYSIE